MNLTAPYHCRQNKALFTMAKTFQCTLLTPEKQVLVEQLLYASIPAWDGLLGVAHMRAPLVVKLGVGVLRLDVADGDPQSFFVGDGFAQMKDNKLALLTDEAIPAGEIDGEQARAALEEAQERVAIDAADVERKLRDVAKARTMVSMASD